MTTLKLLIWIPESAVATGSVRRLTELAYGLRQLDIDAQIATPNGGIVPHICRAKSIPFYEIRLLETKKNATFLQKARWALSLIRENDKNSIRIAQELAPLKPDVIIARNALGVLTMSPLARRLQAPIIWDVGIETRNHISYILFRLAAQESAAVVTQSRRQLNDIFGKYISTDKFKNFVSITPGIPEPTAAGAPKDHEFIICPASITPRKSQINLIKAFHIYKRKINPDSSLKLKLAGAVQSQSYHTKLRRVIRNLDLQSDIDIMGWTNDLSTEIISSKGVILSSSDEGVPNSVQEAMWLGCPVVATTVGGIPEIMQHQRTGYLVPPNDVSALAEGVAWLDSSSEKKNEIVRHAMHFAQSNFSMASWLKSYRNLILGLVPAHDNISSRLD